MSREIKFRAWHKKRRIMAEVLSHIHNGRVEVSICDSGPFLWRDVEDIEVMQYTGLKDKNGVEIYEGDILQTGGTTWLKDYQHGVNENQAFQEVKRLEVAYCGTSFIGKNKKYKDGYPLSTILLHDNDGLLVIGDIHQNPELIASIGEDYE